MSASSSGPSFTLRDLLDAYAANAPDMDIPEQRVSFGTSGHRGSALAGSFNEAHILAITQAVCEYRTRQGIAGPLFMGRDTHALSVPALETALEVLAANGVETRIQQGDAPTPTPVVSHAILVHNAGVQSRTALADGIVITPSHNPPEDGGFKYNEPHGGPSGLDVTTWIEQRANDLLRSGNRGVKRASNPRSASCIREIDFVMPYVRDMAAAIDMPRIASSGLRLGVDPLGGASLPFWEPLAATYGLNLTVVNPRLDPLFSFMPPDHDGRTRMDCSSPAAMAGLISLAAKFDLAFANDPDADRHGIVTPDGLMNPNQYLSTAVWFLLRHRPNWPKNAAIGKTAVTTGLIDRICAYAERDVYETPVGFKWFVDGLLAGTLLFGGEESAGASFLRMTGKVWTTDKDGILLNLLAAEMTAVTGKNPSELYAEISGRFGAPRYARLDAPATTAQKKMLKEMTPAAITRKTLAGSPITGVLTHAPGNSAALGGLKVITDTGWFAARPSGTEDLYKIYAESFVDDAHLRTLQEEARALVAGVFAG